MSIDVIRLFDPPNADDEVHPSGTYQILIKTVSTDLTITNYDQELSPAGTLSTVELSFPANGELKFALSTGSMPPGMELNDDGTITGVLAKETVQRWMRALPPNPSTPPPLRTAMQGAPFVHYRPRRLEIFPIHERRLTFNVEVILMRNTSASASLRELIESLIHQYMDRTRQPQNFMFRRGELTSILEHSMPEIDFVVLHFPTTSIRAQDNELLTVGGISVRFAQRERRRL
jgi:hypothetical protein